MAYGVKLYLPLILRNPRVSRYKCRLQRRQQYVLFVTLNVNIPNVKTALIKGIKICKQSYAKYDEKFIERTDPHGKKYYWLTGEFVNFDKSKDTDVWALKNNYVSVVPVQFDLTNHLLKDKLSKKWKW